MVYCAADTSCAGGGTGSQAFPSNRLSAIGKFSRRSSSWSVLGERSRQRCTGAIDYNPGAALAGVLGGDEFAVVSQRPACLHGRCYRAGSFHIADARHFYRRCPYPFLANLPTQADHGAWHPGDSVIENSALIVVPGVLAIGATDTRSQANERRLQSRFRRFLMSSPYRNTAPDPPPVCG
jgi:hypothetical protein